MGPARGDEPSAAADWLPADIPPQLGLYRLLRPLGQGGLGMVFEGRHRLLDQRAAVKVLHPRLAADPRLVARFRREMTAFGRVPDHPNLTRAAYAGEDAGVLYLVMDYLDGADLSRVLDRHGPLPPAAACEAVRQALVGLGVVGRAGLVHRDLKPANLMLTPGGTVKILDLGLALLRDADGGGELTPSGVTMGTFDYLAPEQAADPRRVDVRADVYSLGCTLYKLLTGRVPFPGRSSLAEKLLAHATTPFPPVGDAGLDAVLARMTAKNSADRYPDPDAAEAALRPFAAGHHLTGLADLGPETAVWTDGADTPAPGGTTPGPAAPTTPATTQTSAPARRRGLGLAVGLVATAVAVGIVATRGGSGRPTDPAATAPAEPVPVPSAVPADGVLPPGTPPRPLDGLALFQVHDLLDRPPVAAHWHAAGGTAARAYDGPARLLRVDAPRFGLLHLGTVARPDYTVEVQFHQSRWKGGVGVYLGHRPDPETGGAVFQYLMFNDRAGADGRPQVVLTRGRGRAVPGPGGEQLRWADEKDEVVPTPIQVARLAVEVSRAQVARVRLDLDRDLKLLVHRDVAGRFSPDDVRGALGLLTKSNACVFTDARLRLTGEP